MTETWPTRSGNPPRRYHGITPWTVLDASSGPWQAHKKHLAAMIDDGAGRDHINLYTGKHNLKGGMSRFDPVLADCMYEWYAPHGGTVYDPFAGGPTRGIIATQHDLTYTGRDINPTQVEANQQQAATLGVTGATWEVGDALTPAPHAGFDMILTCPPYYNLERYTDNPRDLSTMTWAQHLDALEQVAHHCHTALADNRFLAWVTGDLRDSKGHQRSLPEHTLTALLDAGFHHINTHILVTPVGTRYLNLRRGWTHTRTAGRRHEHIYIMCKGDRRKATAAINNGYRQRGYTYPDQPDNEPHPHQIP